MSDTTQPATAGAVAAPAEHAHHDHTQQYVRIWGILVVLLIISVAGPFLGIRWVTLITAFGIALVKAYMVAKHFMHISLERKWILYLVATMLTLMAVMVAGVSPDVMQHHGRNWENVAAKAWVEKGLKEGGGEHGAEHGAKPVEGAAAHEAK
jgi:caa(3)-type oxidase subunit IV